VRQKSGTYVPRAMGADGGWGWPSFGRGNPRGLCDGEGATSF
jgi:hypothetical protein